jgi:PknH-like extracellular domain
LRATINPALGWLHLALTGFAANRMGVVEYMYERRVALILAVACVLVGACGGSLHKSSTPTTTTSSTPPPPVAVGALDALLLSPAEVNTAMGATDMTFPPGFNPDAMFDDSAGISDKACLFATDPAEQPVYAGSGYTASRKQVLREPVDNYTHLVAEAAVAFPTAAAAGAFFTASTQSWAGCSNRQYTFTPQGHPAETWQVGAVSNSNGMLSVQLTNVGLNGYGCERALTVRKTVAVDVIACAYSPGDAGIRIATQIAAKVGPA